MSEEKQDKPFTSPPVRIVSTVDGFRRGGIAHPAAAVDHDAGEFTAEQWAAIDAEARLIKSEVPPAKAKIKADGIDKK